MASGRGSAAAQADSSPGQIGSSASGGAPWLRYTAGIRLLLMAIVLLRRQCGHQIGVTEVISLKQQRFAGGLGQGVCEAVPEVKASLVAAALPEVPVRAAGRPGLVVCHRF